MSAINHSHRLFYAFAYPSSLYLPILVQSNLSLTVLYVKRVDEDVVESEQSQRVVHLKPEDEGAHKVGRLLQVWDIGGLLTRLQKQRKGNMVEMMRTSLQGHNIDESEWAELMNLCGV